MALFEYSILFPCDQNSRFYQPNEIDTLVNVCVNASKIIKSCWSYMYRWRLYSTLGPPPDLKLIES